VGFNLTLERKKQQFFVSLASKGAGNF